MGNCCPNRQSRYADGTGKWISTDIRGGDSSALNGAPPNVRYVPEPLGHGTMFRSHGDVIRKASPASGGSTRLGHLASEKVVVAIHEWHSREVGDISFKKGDKLEVLRSGDNNDWWFARNLNSGQEGYIHSSYVAEETSNERHEWFFGRISRKEAEKVLLQPHNPRGTYLIRNSEQNPGSYSLSVKDWEQNREEHVKHYKIKTLDSGGFYITPKTKFSTLEDLVRCYAGSAAGLCHRLTLACPRPRPQLWDLSPETKDHWEIDRNELHFLKRLGAGNFGEVWYGKYRNHEVAIKTLKPGTMTPTAFMEEAAIMKNFRHRNLVALYAVCSTKEPLFIITEYMKHGSLLDFLRNGQGKTASFTELLDIAAQIASGMSYLEKRQLIHRDLAARNVLIGDPHYTSKICDFGLARQITDDEYNPKQGAKFPVKWTAPEAILYGKFTIKSDVWSFGILLMELFTYGQVPYPGMNNHEVVDQVSKGYRMPKPGNANIPDTVYECILSCWDAKPDTRPTFEFLYSFYDDFQVASEVPYREVVD